MRLAEQYLDQLVNLHSVTLKYLVALAHILFGSLSNSAYRYCDLSWLSFYISMFESVDRPTDVWTDRCQLDGYTLSSLCEPLAQVS